MPLTAFLGIWAGSRIYVAVLNVVYSATEYVAIKIPGALEISTYQKASAVFGGIFVGYWVVDLGVRLLAASKTEGSRSVKELHDHWVKKNGLQKLCSTLVSVLTLTGLALYTIMTVKREIIPQLNPKARQ